MRILRSAADHHRRARFSGEGRLEQQRQLGVVERHPGQRPSCSGAAGPLVQRLHTALQRQQALVNVVRLSDTFAALVVLLPRHARDLFVADVHPPGAADVLVRLTLAHLLGTTQVGQAKERLHGDRGAGGALPETKDDQGVGSSTPLVHLSARFSLPLVAATQELLEAALVRHRLLTAALQDILVPHPLALPAVHANGATQ
mmetsp:Transcript_40649/g.96950  ORF Transcript_40649/g.96950 Transcript_40649/m.96950 type:complete len:201 (-) Transcript_40649:1240-1842(-)